MGLTSGAGATQTSCQANQVTMDSKALLGCIWYLSLSTFKQLTTFFEFRIFITLQTNPIDFKKIKQKTTTFF